MEDFYDFHYKLNDNPLSIGSGSQEDFYAGIIKSLITIIEFTNGEDVVPIDGFKFVNNDKIVSIFNRDVQKDED